MVTARQVPDSAAASRSELKSSISDGGLSIVGGYAAF
jgi:hypothetical protein